MKFIIIQFSDIHFKDSSNSINNKAEQLYSAIANHTLELEKIILLITGDIAYSGKENEYNIANEFFTDLVLKLEIYSGKNIEIIMIPGNHDCDFSKNDKVRDNMIKMIQSAGEDVIDDSVIDILTTPQTQYKKFYDSFNNINNKTFHGKLLDIYEFNIGSKKIVINALNSSYISQLHEHPGSMLIPVNNLGYDLSSINGDFIITTLHHPLHWLNPDNRREVKNIIENTSDVYITGHEHQSKQLLISDFESNSTIYLEGAVVQDSNDPDNSSFNLIIVDLEYKKIRS